MRLDRISYFAFLILLLTVVTCNKKKKGSGGSSPTSAASTSDSGESLGIGGAGATYSIAKPCPDRAGSSKYFEGSGACTGNLATAITLPTAGISLFHNSLRADYKFCVSSGWSISTDRFITPADSTITNSMGTTTGFKSVNGSTRLQSIDPIETTNTLDTTTKPEDEVLKNIPNWYGTEYQVDGTKYHYLAKDKYDHSLLGMITDRHDRTTTITRDANGCITHLVTANKMSVSFGYADGRLSTVTDNAKRSYELIYDPSTSNLIEVRQPGGSRWTMDYVPYSGLVRSLRTPQGEKTEFTYFPGTGVLRSINNPSNWLTVYDYTANSVTVTESDAITQEDFSEGRHVGTTSQGQRTTIARDNEGRVTATTDAMGRKTTLSYNGPLSEDRLNSVPSKVTLPDSTSITYQYDTNMNLVSSTAARDGNTITTIQTWDAYGQLLLRSINGRKVTYQRTNGNLTAVIDQTGKTVYSATYDNNGNLASYSDKFGRTYTLTWLDGRVVNIKDYLGRSTSFDYDPLGKPLNVSSPDGLTVASTYDKLGRLYSTTTSYGSHNIRKINALEFHPSGVLKSQTLSELFDNTYMMQDVTNFADDVVNDVKTSHILFTNVSGNHISVEGIGSDGSYGIIAQSNPRPGVTP